MIFKIYLGFIGYAHDNVPNVADSNTDQAI